MVLKTVWNFGTVFCLFLAVPYKFESILTIEFSQVPQYADKFVSSGILWNKGVRNIFGCAIECHHDVNCVSYFYESKTCNGYGTNAPIAANVIADVGSRYYIRHGLTLADDDMSTSFSITTTEATTTTTQEITTKATTTSNYLTTQTPTTQDITARQTTTQDIITQATTPHDITTTQTTTIQDSITTQATTSQDITTQATTTTQDIKTTQSTTTQDIKTTQATTTQDITSTQATTTEDITTSFLTSTAGSTESTTSSSTWCTGDRFVKDTSNNRCYKAWTTQASWAEAQKICNGEGGYLAVLDTDAKINLVATIPDYQCSPGKLGPFVNKCYWKETSATAWEKNRQMCYNNGGGMLASFPDNATYYIAMDGIGILNSTDSWWIGPNDMTTEGVLYTAEKQAVTWNNMVIPWGYPDKDCILISPNHNFQWIEETCSLAYPAVCEKYIETDFWIGGKDSTSEGDWLWTSGAKMDTSKWHINQPNGTTLENCAVLRYDTHGTKFADENCALARNFICEKAI